MVQYIDKAALVAEIEKRLEEYRTFPDYQTDSNYMELCEILSFLDSLEVKEVDEEYNGKAMLHVLEKGVEQGKREMLNKTYIWLKENKDHPFIGCEDCCLSGFLTDEFIEEFRKAMEE